MHKPWNQPSLNSFSVFLHCHLKQNLMGRNKMHRIDNFKYIKEFQTEYCIEQFITEMFKTLGQWLKYVGITLVLRALSLKIIIIIKVTSP